MMNEGEEELESREEVGAPGPSPEEDCPGGEEEEDWETDKSKTEAALAGLDAKDLDDVEGPIKVAARKCDRIMEALDAVANKQMRSMLQERLARAERELDQLLEFGSGENGAVLVAKNAATSSTLKAKTQVSKSPKTRTTESVKSRFKGVYGVRSLKKGSIRWTAKLLKDNTWYRDGSYTDEEEAARAVDARLRAWGRSDECNFDDDGVERPARERKHGSSKRRASQAPPTQTTEPKRQQLPVVNVHHPMQLPGPNQMPLFPN